MQTKPGPIPWWLLVIGAAAIGGDFGYHLGANRQPSDPSFVRAADEPIVNKASDFYGRGKVSREALREANNIDVVYLPTMTCVGFNTLPRTLGSDDTVCLDKSGQRVVLTYRDGE
jgi:hypothetical protein